MTNEQLIEHNSIPFEEIEDNYYYDNTDQDNILNNLFIEQLRNEFIFLFTYLDQIQEEIIRMFFGFDCNPKKIEDIAKIYNISNNEVIKIIMKTKNELKFLGNNNLYQYLDYLNDINDGNSKIICKVKRNQN